MSKMFEKYSDEMLIVCALTLIAKGETIRDELKNNYMNMSYRECVKKALVGTGSYIKGEVKNSVLFRDVVVEDGAKIKNSIIMQKCHIGLDAVIENAIIEKSINVSDGVVYKGTKSNPIVVSNEW